MKVARLVIALTATCGLIAILVLPQIIEAKRRAANSAPQGRSEVITGSSVHNDKSEPLRDMKQLPIMRKPEREANENPRISHSHRDVTDPVVQNAATASVTANMPGTTLNFDGIPFPGVACNCAPPDTNGAVGATQYVQIVNEGYQVFDKTSGASQLGPSGIASIWMGVTGLCATSGEGDPVVLYDHIANRSLVSQIGGSGVP